MERIVGVTELQRHCRQVIDEVVDQRRPVILTRGSRPAAVIVPYDDYVRQREGQRQRAATEVRELMGGLREREKAKGATMSDEEAMEMALAEVHAVREERRRYETAAEPRSDKSA